MRPVLSTVLATLFIWHVSLVEGEKGHNVPVLIQKASTSLPGGQRGPVRVRSSGPVQRQNLAIRDGWHGLSDPDQSRVERQDILEPIQIFGTADDAIGDKESSRSNADPNLLQNQFNSTNNADIDNSENSNTLIDKVVLTEGFVDTSDDDAEVDDTTDEPEGEIFQKQVSEDEQSDSKNQIDPSSQDISAQAAILEQAKEEGIVNKFAELIDILGETFVLANDTAQQGQKLSSAVDKLESNLVMLDKETYQVEQAVYYLQKEINYLPTTQTIAAMIHQIVQPSANQYPNYERYPSVYRSSNVQPVHRSSNVQPVHRSSNVQPVYRSSNVQPVVLRYSRALGLDKQKRHDSVPSYESNSSAVIPKESCIYLTQNVTSQLLMCVENQKNVGLLKSDRNKSQIKNIVTDFCTTIHS